MRRGLRILLAVLAAIVVLLVLNKLALDHQTKGAEVTFKGAKIMSLPGGDLQVLDSGPVASLSTRADHKPPLPDSPPRPIVLLHCYTCSINWWSELIPLLEKGGHRVIAIDLLGHGGSEKPSSGYSMQDQAQLVGEALNRLGVRRATVVGHSLGGAVAVALAEQSPQLVGRLVIIDTEPDTSYGSLDLLARAAHSPFIGEAMWRIKTDSAIREGLKQAFAPGYDVPDQFVDDLRRMTFTSYKESSDQFDSYVGDSPLDRRVTRLGLPLLAIFGAKDQIADARPALSAYAGVPGAQTALVLGAGHSPNVEKPIQTASLIERFASSPGTASPTRGSKPSAVKRRRRVTATCDKAIIGPGGPDWRKRSTAVGDFGLYGSGRNLSEASPVGGNFVTKVPAVLEGHGTVTLRVPASERGRVGLIYGPAHDPRQYGFSLQRVDFRPCESKSRTVWPGGLLLTDRRPISLEVVSSASAKKLRLR